MESTAWVMGLLLAQACSQPGMVATDTKVELVKASGMTGSELAVLQTTGATDVLLYPASGGLEQVGLLTEALRQAGFTPAGNP